MDKYMSRAVQLAVNNVKEGGQPFGAVLVKDGEIIAEGVNELHVTFDISAHAEMLAIRKAQHNLKTLNLEGFTMYASGEPCPMCLTAIYNSGIQKIYYAESIEDAGKAGFDSVSMYREIGKPREERTISIKQMPLSLGQTSPFSIISDDQIK